MKVFLTLFLLTVLFCSKTKAQIFYNSELEKIYSKIPVKAAIHPNIDTIFTSTINIDGKKINYHLYSRKSIITHIGIKLFSDSTSFYSNNSINNFIERKLLYYILSNNTDEIKNDLNLNGAYLTLNGVEFGSHNFKSLSNALNIFDSNFVCKLYSDSLVILIKISNQSSELVFFCKKNFYTISGLNKIEADSFFVNEIATCSSTENKDLAAISSELIHLVDSVFIVEGNSYLQVMSNNFFVVKRGDKLKTLYALQYPIESFVNSILQPDSTCNFTNVLLEHKLYGKTKKQIVNLTCLINYLKQDHELYFGLEDTSSTLSGTLIAVNKNLNYLHLFYFTTSKKILFSSHREYVCKLYSFIPTDNIKNLFSDVGEK